MTKTDSSDLRGVAVAAASTLAAARDAAQDMGRSMSDRLDDMKSQSADALHSGAESVRDAAQRGSAAMANAGERVAEKLDSASSFVGVSNVRSLVGDLGQTVSRYPAGFLIMAAAFGFYAGTVFSRTRNNTSPLLKEELK